MNRQTRTFGMAGRWVTVACDGSHTVNRTERLGLYSTVDVQFTFHDWAIYTNFDFSPRSFFFEEDAGFSAASPLSFERRSVVVVVLECVPPSNKPSMVMRAKNGDKSYRSLCKGLGLGLRGSGRQNCLHRQVVSPLSFGHQTFRRVQRRQFHQYSQKRLISPIIIN